MDSDSLKLDLVSKSLAKDIARRNRRSTLTQGNAEMFREAYEEVNKTGREVCIRYVDYFQITPHTLYKKMVDGLAWLSMYDEEKEKWALFRNKVKFHMSDDPTQGIIIRPRDQMIRKKSVTFVEPPSNAEWQTALHTWLNNSPDGQPFLMKNLNLSIDQKTYIEKLFEGVNENRVDSKGNPNPIVFSVTLDSIRAVK